MKIRNLLADLLLTKRENYHVVIFDRESQDWVGLELLDDKTSNEVEIYPKIIAPPSVEDLIMWAYEHNAFDMDIYVDNCKEDNFLCLPVVSPDFKCKLVRLLPGQSKEA